MHRIFEDELRRTVVEDESAQPLAMKDSPCLGVLRGVDLTAQQELAETVPDPCQVDAQVLALRTRSRSCSSSGSGTRTSRSSPALSRRANRTASRLSTLMWSVTFHGRRLLIHRCGHRPRVPPSTDTSPRQTMREAPVLVSPQAAAGPYGLYEAWLAIG
jgi:hypothetical protein